MWRRKETFLGYSCLQKAISLSMKRTWGQGQNICCPHTQSPHENPGVNPVSNKLGLTLINPTTVAANATTQNEIPGLLTYICACAQTINLTYTHRKKTHAHKHILSTHSIKDFTVSLVWCSLHFSSCVCGQAAMLTAEGLFHKTLPPAFPSLMISITNML